MSLTGIDYILEPPFDQIARTLLQELGSEKKVRELPYDVLFKVMAHPDETHFISGTKPSIKLSSIVGPYTVYDESRSFLCTVNLHKGFFGATLPEIDYIRKVPDLTTLFVSYVDSDNLVRDIQLIKLGGI